MNETLRRFFDLYNGRINRWQFVILTIIMDIIAFIMMKVVIASGAIVVLNMGNVLALLSLLLTMHLYVRRLHDMDISGWFALVIILLTLVHANLGFMCFVILAVVQSVPYTNQYGGVPKKDRTLFNTFMNT